MVAWWPLDETTGNTVHDIIGNHDGTTQSGPIGAGGPGVASAPKVGSALFFGMAKAEVADDPALNFGAGDFSIDAWVRSFQSSLLSAVVDKLDTTSAVPKGYAFFVQNGKVQLQMANGATTSIFQSSNTFVANGTWRHVAVTVQRASGGPVGQFYIDGVPAGPTFTPLAGNIDSNAKLLIGNYRLSSGQCSCEVSLDEIELFNTDISPNAIQAIFQADTNGKCKATISGLKFNDLNGNGVRDVGEPGLPGWTIKITDSSGNIQTTTTDASGNYSFVVPAPGNYTVSEIQQAGWIQTAPTSGTYSAAVTQGQVLNLNFGNKKQSGSQPDLTIKKVVKCIQTPVGNVCTITLTITNNGPGTFNGFLVVQDVVTPPPTSGLSFGGPTPTGWSCSISPSNTINCAGNSPVSLAPGTSTTVGVPIKFSGIHFTNCASVLGYIQSPFNSSTLIQETNVNNNKDCVPML